MYIFDIARPDHHCGPTVLLVSTTSKELGSNRSKREIYINEVPFHRPMLALFTRVTRIECIISGKTHRYTYVITALQYYTSSIDN